MLLAYLFLLSNIIATGAKKAIIDTFSSNPGRNVGAPGVVGVGLVELILVLFVAVVVVVGVLGTVVLVNVVVLDGGGVYG